MKSLHTWLTSTFTASAVTFVAGLLTSIIVRAIFGQIIPLNVGIIALSTIVLVVTAIGVIVGIRQEIISSLIQSKLSARVYHSLKTPNGDIPLYEPVIQVISSAKESIRVVSLYRPPTLESMAGRRKYYEKIDEILEDKHRRGERFRYERIIQVKEVNPGRLVPDVVDEVTFQHCKHLLSLQSQKTALTIHMRQIPDILGSLSFIIVDDMEIVFAVPSVTRTETAQLKAVQLGTGIIFADNEGSLVKEMLNLYDDLRMKADEIVTLDD